MIQRILKFLHEVGAVGVLGAFACCLVLIVTTPREPLLAYAAVRKGIAAITHWVLVPSLGLVLVSGLLSIAANRAYTGAGWAWVKALLGISMFEGTLITVDASARHAAELAAQAAAGAGDPARLAAILRTEWGSLWILTAVAVANIVLAVWRPRFLRRRAGDDPSPPGAG